MLLLLLVAVIGTAIDGSSVVGLLGTAGGGAFLSRETAVDGLGASSLAFSDD
ncbi:hypothetical protein D3C80_2236820 [compost metagenome]